MSIELFLRIGQVSEALNLLGLILTLIFFNRRILETRILAAFLLCSVLTYISLYLIHFKGKEINMPQAICGILQFLITTVLYNYVLKGKYKTAFIIISIGFLLFSIGNMLFLQKLDNNTYTLATIQFITLIYCVLYWYRLLVELPVQELHRFPMFWYNSAYLIFSAGTLFLYLFASYLTEVLNNDLLIYWSFHNILVIAFRIVIVIGLWQDLRNIRSGSSLPLAQ